MLLAILKPQQVCYIVALWRAPSAYQYIDDVRDIYRRAEQEELVVEGLREGDNLVGQE